MQGNIGSFGDGSKRLLVRKYIQEMRPRAFDTESCYFPLFVVRYMSTVEICKCSIFLMHKNILNVYYRCTYLQIYVIIFSWLRYCLFFFFLMLFRATPAVRKFPGERSYQSYSYTTVTAMQDPSHICDLHHSSRQRCILNPLSKARDRIHILMDSRWIPFHCATAGTL